MNRDEAVAQLHANYATFVALCAEAERSWHVRRTDEALVRAQIAADFAWHSHPGVFVSSTLERLVHEVGRELDISGRRRSSLARGTAAPGGVVHVMTFASLSGGHSRAVWRWIEHDSERTHSVVLTRQAGRPIPQALKTAVEQAGGQILQLDRAPGGLVDRAKRLRVSCGEATCIALHIHPCDVVPGVAFADGVAPAPLIFFNHADHVFWLGARVSTVVANIREVGRELTLSRRGISEQQSVLLPIPLAEQRPRRMSKLDAKLRLGVPEDALLLLSAAAEYKYASGDGPHLTEIIEPVLRNHRNALFLAAGPSDRGEWARARRRTSGQVRPLGVLSSVRLLYDAADVYLDSWPFSSLTSMLEAADHGVPVIALHASARDHPVLGPDDPAVNQYALFADDNGMYQSLLRELITDPKLRSERGEMARDIVASVHSGTDWRLSLGYAYECAQRLRTTQTAPPATPIRPEVNDLDVGLVRLHAAAQIAKDVDRAAFEHYRLLPFWPRLASWKRSMRGRHRLRRALVSEAIGSRIEERLRRVTPRRRPIRSSRR